MSIRVHAIIVLASLAPGVAVADPFFVWGERTPVGAVSLNPYVLAYPGTTGSATMYGFAGVSPSLDIIVGGGAELDGTVSSAPIEAMLRLFPIDQELALAVHLQSSTDGTTVVGPEVHLTSWLSDALGLWVNAGARFDPSSRDATGFVWTGVEVAADVPFVAVELDLEVDERGAMSGSWVPSVGVWLGPQGATGLSAGILLPVTREPVGAGVWLWRTFDLKSTAPSRASAPM